MPQIRVLRLLAVLLSLSVFAVACSGDSTTESTGASTESTGASTDSTETATDDDAADDAVPIDPSEPIAIDGPVDPDSIRQLAGSLTGIDLSSDHVACLLDNSEGDTQLSAVFNGFQSQGFQFTPEAFTALTVNVHDCIDPIELTGTLVALSGGAGDIGQFTTCVATAISDETTGDLAYTGLAALQVQFVVPEGAQEITITTVTECIDRESLTNQLAAAREQTSGFLQQVDRECVTAGLTDEFVASFWEGAVTSTATTEDLEPLLEGCTSEYNSGLDPEVPANFTPFEGIGALAAVDPGARDGAYSEPPPNVLEDGVDYQAIFTTADGEILIDLYEDTAPITVNSFVALARDGYYDLTNFHRVLDGFMAQAGDPTNTGTGGPGFSFDDEASGLTPIDRRGLLAMANSGPNTNGSQFFITLDAATWLDGLHTVFGEVVEGDEILGQVELRDPAQPTSRGEQLISVEIIEA